MYICLCHGITDRQIRRAVEQGACSLGEVQMQLPVGGCCGRCEPAARQLIEEHASGQGMHPCARKLEHPETAFA